MLKSAMVQSRFGKTEPALAPHDASEFLDKVLLSGPLRLMLLVSAVRTLSYSALSSHGRTV